MEPRALLTALAAGRIGVGAALFLAPRATTRHWLGGSVDSPGGRVAVRGLAVRDVALGIGTLTAIDDPDRARPWVEAGILCDVADAAATLMGRRDGSFFGTASTLALALGAAAAGLAARDALGVAGDEFGAA